MAVLAYLDIRMRQLSDTISAAEARRDRLAAAHHQRQLEASKQGNLQPAAVGPQAGNVSMPEAGRAAPAAGPRNSPATPLPSPDLLACAPIPGYPPQPSPPCLHGPAAPSPSPVGTIAAGATPLSSPAAVPGSWPSLQEPSPVSSFQSPPVPQLSPLAPSALALQAPGLRPVPGADLWRGAEAPPAPQRGSGRRRRPVDYDLVYPHITQHYLLASLAGFPSQVIAPSAHRVFVCLCVWELPIPLGGVTTLFFGSIRREPVQHIAVL